MTTYNRVCALFLIALLFSASNPPAHGQLITGRSVTVVGRLCCTSTGNCPGQGVAGVPVSLNCTILGATVTIGQGLTNVNGTFNITVPTSPAVAGLVLGLPFLPCFAAVRLPLDSADVCPALSTTNGTVLPPSLVCPIPRLPWTCLPLTQLPSASCSQTPVVSCIFRRSIGAN